MTPEKIEYYDLIGNSHKHFVKNTRNSRLIDLKKKLIDVIKNMKEGKIFLDPKVPIKSHKGEDINITFSPEFPKSFMINIINLFQALTNECEPPTDKRTNNDLKMLKMSYLNFIYPTLKIMDYMDRSSFRLKKKTDLNLLMKEDEQDILNESNNFGSKKSSIYFDTNETNKKTKTPSQTVVSRWKTKTVNKVKAIDKFRRTTNKIIEEKINSLRDVVRVSQRVMKAKSHRLEESEEMIKIGFKALESLCENSVENKKALFTDDCWYHFERLYMKHPMKVLVSFKKMFNNRKDIAFIFKDVSTIERILHLYESFIKDFFKERVTQGKDGELSISTNIPTNEMALLFMWNNVLIYLLKVDMSM